jgi:aminopeptidase N
VAFDYGDAQLAALVEHDNDGVSRWQAVRELFFRAFDKLRGDGGAVAALDHAVAALLADYATDPALIAHMLAFPSHGELADRDAEIDPAAIASTREELLRQLATTHRAAIIERYGHERIALSGKAWSPDVTAVAHRALAGTLLAFVNTAGDTETHALARPMAGRRQSHRRDERDDCIARPALSRTRSHVQRFPRPVATRSVDAQPLVALEAGALRRGEASAVSAVRALLAHERFDSKTRIACARRSAGLRRPELGRFSCQRWQWLCLHCRANPAL